MIRYRQSNRVRDTIGVAFLVLTATLLWVDASVSGATKEAALGDACQDAPAAVASMTVSRGSAG